MSLLDEDGTRTHWDERIVGGHLCRQSTILCYKPWYFILFSQFGSVLFCPVSFEMMVLL